MSAARRFARITATAALLAVATAGLAPQLPAGELLAPALRMPPATGAAVLLLAIGLWLTTTAFTRAAARCGAAAAGFAALALASWAATALLQAVPASAAKLLALRPAPLAALAIAALGLSLWRRRPERGHFDLSAAAASAAVAASFLVGVAHLYAADALIAAPLAERSTGLAAILLLALSLAMLSLHPAGPAGAYEGDDPAAHTKRRLLPAAVLTPIASGYLLLYALDAPQLSPAAAIALVVFANVLVMLLLIDRAGNKVAEVVEQKHERLRAREAAAKKQGMKDPMTALLNRRGWDLQVQQAERLCRAESLPAAVLVVDLDDLKRVNDRDGHAAGDAYILRAAAALRTVARQGDALARIGGDEFAYLLVDGDEAAARAVAGRFQEALRAKRVSASVGYAMRSGRGLAAAFDEADQAMYRQKRARKLRSA